MSTTTEDEAQKKAREESEKAVADSKNKANEGIKSTQKIIKDFLARIFGFANKLPKPQIGPGEAKRRRGLGNKDYISYKIPWILYFYPDPKADPNYVLLDPENDKILLDKTKKQILQVITLMIFLGIIYSFWQAGALFPALHSAWFFFWRYITLTIFFLCFMIVIAILKGFPFFIRKIKHYAELSINPSLYLNRKKWYNEKTQWIKYTLRGIYRFLFGLATVGWIFLFLCVLVPLFAIFATICGLLLGDLNRTFFAFGMAEYEVTELQKDPLQKRIENATGITRIKQGVSSGLSYVGDKTGISKAMSSVKVATENPFLKYKVPEVPELPKKIPGLS